MEYFLKLLKNDKLRGLISTLLLNKQYKTCEMVMREESEIAQSYFKKVVVILQQQVENQTFENLHLGG